MKSSFFKLTPLLGIVLSFPAHADLGVARPRASRLIAEWCGERSAELQQAWASAIAGKELPWVLPLR